MTNKPIMIFSFLQQVRNICTSQNSYNLAMLYYFSRSAAKRPFLVIKKQSSIRPNVR